MKINMSTERGTEMFVITNDTIEGAYRKATILGMEESGRRNYAAIEFKTLDQYQEYLGVLESHREGILTDTYIAQYQALAPIMDKKKYPIVVVHTDDSILQVILISEGFLSLGDAILSSRGLEFGSNDS